MYIKTETCVEHEEYQVRHLTGRWKKCRYREFTCSPLGFLLRCLCKWTGAAVLWAIPIFLMSCTLFWLKTTGIWLEHIPVLWRELENYGASNNSLEFQNESTYEGSSACVVFFIFLTSKYFEKHFLNKFRVYLGWRKSCYEFFGKPSCD